MGAAAGVEAAADMRSKEVKTAMAVNEPEDKGPFLQAAFLCEKLLTEIDGVKSAIRIVDRVTRQAIGPQPPEEMEPFNHSLVLFIRLKRGWTTGRHTVLVYMVKPSGETPAPYRQDIYFEGEEDWGVDLEINMNIKVDQVGIYWFKIIFNNIQMTRIPLRVIYMPRIIQMQPVPVEPPSV